MLVSDLEESLYLIFSKKGDVKKFQALNFQGARVVATSTDVQAKKTMEMAEPTIAKLIYGSPLVVCYSLKCL